DRKGALVLSAEGPARKAGLRAGDRLIAAKGKDLPGAGPFRAVMADALGDSPSTELPVVLQRGSERVEARLPVELSARVVPPGSAPVPVPRWVATADFEASLLPPGAARSAALLNLASALMGAGEHGQALHLALDRSDWPPDVEGAAATGTASFLAGI